MSTTVAPQVLPAGPAVLEGDSVGTDSEVVMDGGTASTQYIYDNILDGGES